MDCLTHETGLMRELDLISENLRLEEELSQIKIRAGQLVVDLMRKSAQLIEAEEKLKRWQTELKLWLIKKATTYAGPECQDC